MAATEKRRFKLTKSEVEKLDEPGDYRDSELPGFIMRVSKTSDGVLSKRYLVVSKPKGQRTNVSIAIGKHGTNVTAPQAREKARELLFQLKSGINPNEKRRDDVRAAEYERVKTLASEKLEKLTLKKLLDDYLLNHPLKPRTAKNYGLVVRRCLSDWLDVPIRNISKSMVYERQKHLSVEHPAQANLTMRILRALFTYARHAYTDHDDKPLLDVNPVDSLRERRAWNRVQRRQRLILPHQLADWHRAVMLLENHAARDLLLLEIFTGLRQTEAQSITWANVDFRAATIKIEDTKNHDDHLLPMSTFLKQLLADRWQNRDKNDSCANQFVFPRQRTNEKGHMVNIRDSIARVCSESGLKFSEHDLRRTFETCAESLDISAYTLKKLLNHKTNDVTAGYIVTSAERLRGSMQKITDYLLENMEASPDEPGHIQNVFRLPKRGPRTTKSKK